MGNKKITNKGNNEDFEKIDTLPQPFLSKIKKPKIKFIRNIAFQYKPGINQKRERSAIVNGHLYLSFQPDYYTE